MSANSNIEWTDHTFNPWEGCTKVSPGCANCYAETLVDKRYGRVQWGKGQPRRITSKANWKQPLRWNRFYICDHCKEIRPVGAIHRGAGHDLRRQRVFCASLADVFDPEVSDEWRFALFDTIAKAPNLDWLLLTKRPEIAHDFYENKIALRDDTICEKFLPNVWLGVSVEDQRRAEERIPILLLMPAVCHFLSCEPLLGPLDLSTWLPHKAGEDSGDSFIDWVIAGGESGPAARPCDIHWIRSIQQQSYAAGVACFVKQLGRHPYDARRYLELRDKKGGDPSEWPADLRVREFPQPSAPSPQPSTGAEVPA